MPSTPHSSNYYIGLMSGTSMDGVDAVLVDFSNQQPSLIRSHSHPISDNIKQQLCDFISPNWQGSLKEVGVFHQQLGKLFADSVNALLRQTSIPAKQINAIGSHGQTVWHEPNGKHPFSLQLGDANQISELTGISTVADFRSRDIAAGGQGAPLVPAFHADLFSHADKSRVILNIGGIANITLLPSNKSNNSNDANSNVKGFDTGPGNGLLDAWVKLHKNQDYDKHGDWAKNGKINEALLKQLLADPYFSLATPKSTGKEYFNLQWLETFDNSNKIPVQDTQATLTELTAVSIADAVKQAIPHEENNQQLFVCGGGMHNDYLISRLKHHLANMTVDSTEKLGVSPDWMEAIAFAWLAKRTMEGQSGNLPSVTGAKAARVLGAIYPK